MKKKKTHNHNPTLKRSKKKDAITTHYPSPVAPKQLAISKEKRIERIAEHFHSIMELLGLDMQNESLSKTPLRVAKMYVNEVFSGLDPATFPEIRLLDQHSSSDIGHQSLILLKVSFTSFCEHHFVPMIGTAYIAYIPQDRVIGLSKIHRIVRFFAARPQLQERLTAQIADSLSTILNSDDVAVSISAQHLCVLARGVRDEEGITTTNYLSGQFQHNPAKQDEFFRSIERLTQQDE